ncbi:MAG: hypothetical protein FIB06_05520 [Betaproteobacteria bacterium]|nr:hypothetical protein [Betaproteobacteria bacterium]
MPITPFHFGPGALIKVALPGKFSWTIFALANVLIDLEPITLFLLTGDPAHPWLHTLPGALLVAAIAVLLGRRPCELALGWWNRQLSAGWQTQWLAVAPQITKSVAWVSALVGTLSHLALDSIMHLDVHALWPFVKGNALQGSISIEYLHLLCVGAAVVALVGWLFSRAIASR